MKAVVHALVASLILGCSACSLLTRVPPTTTYIVDLPAGRPEPHDCRLPITLRVGNVRVSAAFAGRGLVYRLSDVRYASDPYNRFGAEPGAMLGNRIAEWLDGTGQFRAVVPPSGARPAEYVLDVSVTELFGDFRHGHAPSAVLSMQLALIDQTGARSKVVYERSSARIASLAKSSSEELVRGYGVALAETLQQVEEELRESLAKSAPEGVPHPRDSDENAPRPIIESPIFTSDTGAGSCLSTR